MSAIVGAAFGAAGQRCMALSVVVLVGDAGHWAKDIAEGASRLKVSVPFSCPGTSVRLDGMGQQRRGVHLPVCCSREPSCCCSLSLVHSDVGSAQSLNGGQFLSNLAAADRVDRATWTRLKEVSLQELKCAREPKKNLVSVSARLRRPSIESSCSLSLSCKAKGKNRHFPRVKRSFSANRVFSSAAAPGRVCVGFTWKTFAGTSNHRVKSSPSCKRMYRVRKKHKTNRINADVNNLN